MIKLIECPRDAMQGWFHFIPTAKKIAYINSLLKVGFNPIDFGNPYGDEYNENILLQWANEMIKREIKIISLADTIGVATPQQISFALNILIPQYPNIEFGVHLHSTLTNRKEKLEAAVNAG